MGIFKSEEEKAAEAKQRAEAQSAARAREAEREFWNSEIGQARRAFADGDRFLEIEISAARRKGTVPALLQQSGRTTHAHGGTDTLGGICAEGWKLVNSSWVYMITGGESREHYFNTGVEDTTLTGKVIGLYLFERDETARIAPDDVPWPAR